MKKLEAINPSTWLGVIGALIGPALGAGEALGQSVLEEITVTATKRETSLQSTPIAITALTSEQLNDQGLRNAYDMATAVPGLDVGMSIGNLQIALRGVSNDSFFLSGDPAVAFHVDGVFRGRQTGGNSVFLDVERVEVVKGPQGTLYGRNATAGSINIISAKPTNELEGYVEAAGGNYDYRGGRAVINVPVVKDKIAVRAAVLRELRDGFYDGGPQVDHDYGDMDDTALRLRTLITPSDKLSVLLGFDYQGRDGVGDGAQIVPRNTALKDLENPYRNFINTQGERDDDFHTFSVETTYEFEDATLTYLGAYFDSSVDLLADNDRGDVQRFPLRIRVDSQQKSHELRLASAGRNKLDWLVGGYFFDEDAERYVDVQVSVPLHSQTQQPDFDVRSSAMFGQATYQLADTVRLTTGLRYTKDRKTENNSRSIRTFNGNRTEVIGQQAADWTSTDWTVGMDWFPVEATMLYAKVGTGFKSGGFNDPLTRGVVDPIFKPEEILAYQVGSKSRFASGTLQLNSEAYYYDYSDLQINQIVGTANITRNAANARIKGLDIEAIALPLDELSLTLALGYLDARFDTYQSFDSISGRVEDLSGTALAKSPKWSVSAGARYRFILPNHWQLVPNVAFVYRTESKLRYFEDPGTLQPAWTRTDVSVALKSPGDALNVQLYANNLQDEVVWTNASVNGAGARLLNARAPLMYGLRLRYSFGE